METNSDGNFEAVKASKGSHFQFKSEKEWQSANTAEVTSIFRVNMKTLAEDLSTIPFYERQQLPKELISTQELSAMDKEAKLCSEQRKRNKSELESAPIKEIKREEPSSASLADIQSDIKSLEIEESHEKMDDLEDWLDGVLDD